MITYTSADGYVIYKYHTNDKSKVKFMHAIDRRNTQKAYNQNQYDFSCTPYYLFFFRMSILKSQAYFTSSKINYTDSQ